MLNHSLIMFLMVIFTISGYSIEVQITLDKKIDVSSADIAAMKYFLKKKYNFIANNEKGVKKLVKENRALANAYLNSEYFKKKFNKNLFKIKTEMQLAENFVKELQREIKIPDKVLKSYYYDHLEDFKESPQVRLVRFSFKNYDDALNFYHNRLKSDSVDVKDFNGITRDIGYANIDKIREPLKSLIKENGKNYISPPFIWAKDRYDVYYVKETKKSDGYKKFDQVKNRIKDILYQKTFNKKREEVIKEYLKDRK